MALYAIAIDHAQRWRLTAFGAMAIVDYLAGLQQPGRWHGGVGAGIMYNAPRELWKLFLGGAYGINARRGQSPGAENVVMLFQYDLRKTFR